MKRMSFVALSLLICSIIAFPLSVCASDETEVCVVASDYNGKNNYMASHGDGTFSSQEEMPSISGSGRCYGNGLGDFDNDGDFDYIMALGQDSGMVYLFEKVGPGNQFASPLVLDLWDEGTFAAGMAIADFNEDGHLDFILLHYQSANCSLYLGDGHFGFKRSILTETAPYYSIGADVADLNHDGHADFIAAPYYRGDPFFVNLGNGDGTFKIIKVDAHDQSSYWDAAAADFDDDGTPDLAAIYPGYMDIYSGNGDGSFTWSHRYSDLNIGHSPLDNYDFNNDGRQDIVIARYGKTYPNYKEDIAVFLGNGDGTFSFYDIYGGGAGEDRFSITAPPFEENISPFAMIEPAYQELAAGETAYFDSSGSYDEDGEIVSYNWNFGDGSVAEDTSGMHVFHDVGLYTVTLTVTDNKGASSSAQAQVNVLAVPANVKFTPKKLNLKSKGKWVKATIQLPPGYDVAKIDPNSLCIAERGSGVFLALSDPKYGSVAKVRKGHARRKVLEVRFDRQAIADAMTGRISESQCSKTSVLQLIISGEVKHHEGLVEFSGTDDVRITNRHIRKNHWGRHLK